MLYTQNHITLQPVIPFKKYIMKIHKYEGRVKFMEIAVRNILFM